MKLKSCYCRHTHARESIPPQQGIGTHCTTYTRPSCVVHVASARTVYTQRRTDRQTKTPHPGGCFVVIKAHKSKPLALSSLILHHHCTHYNAKLLKFLPQIVAGEIVSKVLDVHTCVLDIVRTVTQTLLVRHIFPNIPVMEESLVLVPKVYG